MKWKRKANRLPPNSERKIIHIDMDAFFGELDLLKHLSPTRGNGLRSMVARIRQVAQGAK